MYKKDSKTLSTLWGRTGAAILTLLATVLAGYGYMFGEEMQTQVFETIGGLFAGLAFLQVSASKIRESKKLAEDDKTNTGTESK